MGPIWGRQDPGGPHVGHMNFAIRDIFILPLLYQLQLSTSLNLWNRMLYLIWCRGVCLDTTHNQLSIYAQKIITNTFPFTIPHQFFSSISFPYLLFLRLLLLLDPMHDSCWRYRYCWLAVRRNAQPSVLSIFVCDFVKWYTSVKV